MVPSTVILALAIALEVGVGQNVISAPTLPLTVDLTLLSMQQLVAVNVIPTISGQERFAINALLQLVQMELISKLWEEIANAFAMPIGWVLTATFVLLAIHLVHTEQLTMATVFVSAMVYGVERGVQFAHLL